MEIARDFGLDQEQLIEVSFDQIEDGPHVLEGEDKLLKPNAGPGFPHFSSELVAANESFGPPLAHHDVVSNGVSDSDSVGLVRSFLPKVRPSVVSSALAVDFDGSSARLLEQYGQFRLSNQTSSVFSHCRFFITEIGPGLFPGESHQVSISLRNGSKVALESQSATKVHIAPDAIYASIGYRFDVNGGSSLIALQAPTISYGGSKLLSTIEVEVEAGSKAIVSELVAKVAPTDQSTGVTFVDLMIDISYGGELIMVDRIATYKTPIHDEIAAKSVVGGGRGVVGGIYIVGYQELSLDEIAETSRDIAGKISSIEVSSPTSPTPELVLIRAHGDDPYAVEEFFAKIAGAVTKLSLALG
jgi:urease accessory protein UreH